MSTVLSEQCESLIVSNEVMYPGLSDASYLLLFQRYATSDIGQYHGSQAPRYSNTYAYEAELMHTDLGLDVHPVDHGAYTHDEIVQPMLLMQHQFDHESFTSEFNRREIVALRIAALMHDFGECEHQELVDAIGSVTGDVAYGTKTAQHEENEAAIRGYLRQKYYPDIPDELWQDIEEIICEKEDRPGVRAFDLAEHLGYYMTGLRAGYLALIEKRHRKEGEPKRDDVSFLQLSLLGLRVSREHREVTIPARKSGFIFPEFILEKSTKLYEAIQTELTDISEATT